MRNRLMTTISLAAVAAALAGGVRAQDAPKPEQATPTPPGITVNGVVEVNYTYNFNRPANNSNTFLYNTREGQLALNLADVRVGKAATPESRTGFLVRLISGDVEKLTLSPVDNNTGSINVLEAYGTLLLPLGGRDLKVDAGQFVTHIGYETIDLGTNPNFSKSLLFQYPPPFYNAGVRAAYPVSATTTVTGFLLNRYNGRDDTGNRDLAPGFQITRALSPTASLILNGLASRENLGVDAAGNPALNNKQQNILDLVYTNQITPTTRIAVEGLYRWGKDVADNSYGVHGIAGYASFTLASGNVVSLRGEYLKAADPGNPVVNYPSAANAGDKASLSEITLTYDLRSSLFPNVRTLLEFRYDRAGEPFFGARNGGLRKDQYTLTLGQAYGF